MKDAHSKMDWLARLEWIVRLLAQPFDIQLAAFPDFVCVPDELALEFEEALDGFVGQGSQYPSASAAALILELDRKLEAMSGEDNLELWETDALRDSSSWRDVRAIASRAAGAFGWSLDAPAGSDAIYVGPE